MNLTTLAPFGYVARGNSADTWGAMSDIGYHFNLSRSSRVPPLGHWYIEPLLTVAYTQSSLQNITALGTSTLFNDGETFRGAAGASFGGPLVRRGEKSVNFSVTGKYWDEFTNNTQVVLYSLGPALPLTDLREKGYGEVIGTIDFTNLQTGWSGFFDGGAKWNSQFTTTELKGGLRYSW
jgi:outer membrane autotransporter protein